MSKVLDVVKSSGGWLVKVGKKVSAVESTEHGAIKAARAIAKKQKLEIILHGPKGTLMGTIPSTPLTASTVGKKIPRGTAELKSKPIKKRPAGYFGGSYSKQEAELVNAIAIAAARKLVSGA